MTTIPIIYVIRITDIFTNDLTTISEINTRLYKELLNLPYEEIILDFSGVDSVSPEFANYYLSIKSNSEKIIHEVNVPPLLQNTIDCNVF